MIRVRLLLKTAILSTGLVLSGTGCQDQKRIAAQTAEIEGQVDELRAEIEAQEASQSEDPLKKHPMAKFGPKGVEAAVVNLEADHTSLQERKLTLEEQVTALQKDFEEYKTKNN
jgi:outer membrane murein-binding lipoprotein Lpp